MIQFFTAVILAVFIGLGAVRYTNSLPQAVGAPEVVQTTPGTLKAINQAPNGSSDLLGEDLQPATGANALNWKLGK